MAIKTATTKYGIVRGLRAGDPAISVFKGIPYALPPMGALRWKAPQPAKPWTGTLNAYEFGPMPIQPDDPEWESATGYSNYEKSEDCLYLNVWTPAKDPQDKLPVAVWIHGGAYKCGACNAKIYDGEAFAKRGCVFVSFNYRQGLLGFLAHPQLSQENERHISGNYETLDQIMALQWVHENIGAFGGDDGCVTLIGQSAGAHSVMTMCNTPLTEGLFSRAIIQSTGGLSALYYHDEMNLAQAEEEGCELLKRMGAASIEQARHMDAQKITDRLIHAKISDKAPYFPKTDGYVLPCGTITSILKGQQHKVEYLVGATSEETGSMPGFLAQPSLENVRKFAAVTFPEDVEGYLRSVDTSTPKALAETVFNEYENDKLCAALAWQELERQRGGSAAYMYYYTKAVPNNGDHHYGAYHAAELPYIFQTLLRDDRPYNGSDFDFSNLLCEYWTNFVKTGNPNGKGLPKWNKPEHSCYEAMELGNHVGMVEVPTTKNREFVIHYMLAQAKKQAENAGLIRGNCTACDRKNQC